MVEKKLADKKPSDEYISIKRRTIHDEHGNEFEIEETDKLQIVELSQWDPDSKITEIDPIKKPKRKDSIVYFPPEGYQLIYDFLPEFKKIWNAIGALPGAFKDLNHNVENMKWATLQCFESHSDWKYLTKELLKNSYVWTWRGGHERPDFRGKLLVKIFELYLPSLIDEWNKKRQEEGQSKLNIKKTFIPGHIRLEKIAKELETDTS
jgi:hypothetical protein